MTTEEVRGRVLDALGGIAPEADLSRLNSRTNLRDQIDIDSMDFLNFVIAIHKAFELEIPERDYPLLSTLDGCVNYVMSRMPKKA